MDINSLVNGTQLNNQAASKTPGSLGKNDFLNLLVLQMRNQDPLNPMDNQAMLSQMAQFSSLEQMSNLNDNLANSNNRAAFMDATRLLGKQVELLDPTSSPDSPGTLVTKVQSITYTTNGPLLKLENGMETTVEQILRVSEPAQG